MEQNIKLTQAQMKVLRQLASGFTPVRGKGSSIQINDKKICNVDTITSLVKKGLLSDTWQITTQGAMLANRLFNTIEKNY